MKRAARTIAIVAMTVAVGCTTQLTPATPPPTEVETLRFYSTPATSRLATLLLDGFHEQRPDLSYDVPIIAPYNSLESRLRSDQTLYFLSHHLNVDAGVWAVPLAQDALVMIVHPGNPVRALDLTTLRRIYRGYVSNWQAVGGADQSITIYSREAGSGTRLEFERLVMGQQQTSPNAQILPSSAAMLERIANDPQGIGYLPLSQIEQQTGILIINDVLPSVTSIVDNTYPLRMTVYMIGQREPNGLLRDFLRWSQSVEGQSMLSLRYAPLPR